MKHKILIISYHFPPHDNISSRRWAKFAKYLVRDGHQVDIISAKPPSGQKSPWDDDIEGLNVHYIGSFYPSVLSTENPNFLEKILYRFWLVILKLMVKGTIYDRAIFWKKNLMRESKQIIKSQGITVVISNGPPHRAMYYSAQLKNEFKHLKIISDFRDPWTWWYNLGYPYLKDSGKAFEMSMQSFVVSESDIITVPIEEMKIKLGELYPQAREKIKVLPHAFDEDSIIQVKDANSGCIKKWVYYGNIYAGQTDEFRKIGEFLQKNTEVSFTLFSNESNYKELLLDDLRLQNVFYHPTLPEKELFKELIGFDAVVLVLPEIFSNYFSTKIMEIVCLRIPIILIGFPGELSRFIVENKLGIFIESADISIGLQMILSDSKDFVYNCDFDATEFSFKKQAGKLVGMIGSLNI